MSAVALCPENARNLYAWDELALLWNAGDFGAVHDWLGLRWNKLIQTRAGGMSDKDARFLQGLAFAALAFHFTQNRNQDGARLLAADALAVLPEYGAAHMGVETGPVLKSLTALRPKLENLNTEADCPIQPFVTGKLIYRLEAR